MPRKARVVVPGIAHHVTQRGTDRQIVFYCGKDRRVYLRLLKEHCGKASVRILAYCLMPNHIHLVVVPEDEDSLAVALRRVHGRYAQYLNARRVRTGHLWQNRFYSCALDEGHLWAAVGYVERNPVRAGLVESPGEYRWSSAAAHLTGRDAQSLLDMAFWAAAGGASSWAALLAGRDEEQQVKLLMRATYAGNPLGTKEFLDRIGVIRRQRVDVRKGVGSEFGRYTVSTAAAPTGTG
ncbi:MAG: transposase [Candidatus Solibacter usitatus]|nr:transposase [Candidatus Solibacter usitatus]